MSAPQQQSPSTGGGYKRASRRGAPRRYACHYPGCDKIYSRQEHLQRHQLNHSPKEIFTCDVENCNQRFVRADLLSRHKKRHSGSYTPRNRIQSFSEPQNTQSVFEHMAEYGSGNSTATLPGNSMSETSGPPGTFRARLHPFSHPSPSMPHDSAILMSPESSAGQLGRQMLTRTHDVPHPSSEWPASAPIGDLAACDTATPSKTSSYFHTRMQSQTLQDAAPIVLPFNSMQLPDSSLMRDYFTMWLFDNQANFGDLNIGQLPFLEGGLESPFNNNIHYDYESLTSRSRGDSPPRQLENDEGITELRRQELLQEFDMFRTRRPRAGPHISNLGQSSAENITVPNLEVLNDCLYEYWEYISPRVPIIHQPTFFCNLCPPLLLLVMIALGGASLHGRHGAGNGNGNGAGAGALSLEKLGAFADSTITSIRWEILTADEASPPVALWVAQALLLLEFYEKMYSSRRLHERSHIYHSATLTLLRRGSPLIGRSGSESPPDETSLSSAMTTPSVPMGHADHTLHTRAQQQVQAQPQQPSDWHDWWIRWAETEAMHRVVFAAFCFDVTHAAMFGHAADMAPHEIRLPLPCDDNLWTAWKPDDVRKLDTDLRMYGVKPIFFLDGLKRALHGQEVKTHSFGRMIIMSGLLSVGWHLSHREKHVALLDLKSPSSEAHDKWRTILLGAFDNWKQSFDMARGASGAASSLSGEPSVVGTGSTPISRRGSSNGPIQSAAVLYHLAHISLNVDIIDCQVYAGVKRLLGRKVTARDHANVGSRMRKWATKSSTRHAILHAFRILHHVIVHLQNPAKKRCQIPGVNPLDLPPIENQTYSCRTESDPHRPWIMYYAALSIWAFVQALKSTGANADNARKEFYQQLRNHHYQKPATEPAGPMNPYSIVTYHRVAAYLSRVSDQPELTEATAFSLSDGLPDLLDYLQRVFSEAHSELLQEAHVRLKKCRDILLGISE